MNSDTVPEFNPMLCREFKIDGPIRPDPTITYDRFVELGAPFKVEDIAVYIASYTLDEPQFHVLVVQLFDGRFVAIRRTGKHDASKTFRDLVLFGLTEPERQNLKDKLNYKQRAVTVNMQRKLIHSLKHPV